MTGPAQRHSLATAGLAMVMLICACGTAGPPVAGSSPSPSEVVVSPALPSPSPSPAPTPGPTPGPTVAPTSVPTVEPTAEPTGTPQPEWLAGLRPNSQSFRLNRPVALIEIPSGRWIATVGPGDLAVAYETVSGGLAYWLTEYSVSRGLPNGLLKDEVEAAVRAPAPTPTATGVPASLAGAEWTALPTDRKVVALTFDAGGNDAGVAAILAALSDAGAPATFFLTGRWTEVYPDAACRIAAAYPIGNHTYSHPHLTGLSDAAVDDQVAGAADVIEATCGQDPRPLFRFPYGESDARTLGLVHALGYGGIRWTVDTLGWEGRSAGQTPETVLSRVLAKLGPGEIVLMHVGAATDGTTLDADALPAVIREVRARGYELVAVADFV